MADVTYRREPPYLVRGGPAVQYTVLLDGEPIGHVYGWDAMRDAGGRWYGRRVLRREWHSGTSTPWHRTRAAAAADVVSRHRHLVQLTDLPPGTRVLDRMGDIGTVRDGWIDYPETAPQSLERAQKKYAPFRVMPAAVCMACRGEWPCTKHPRSWGIEYVREAGVSDG